MEALLFSCSTYHLKVPQLTLSKSLFYKRKSLQATAKVLSVPPCRDQVNINGIWQAKERCLGIVGSKSKHYTEGTATKQSGVVDPRSAIETCWVTLSRQY